MTTMLPAAKVPFDSTTIDTTPPEATQDAAITEIPAKGARTNFASLTTGSVLKTNPASSMEHVASFQPAHELTVQRDWPVTQKG